MESPSLNASGFCGNAMAAIFEKNNIFCKNIISLINVIFLCSLCVGCNKPAVTLICSTPFIVDEKGMIFNFDTPLQCRQNMANVRVALEGDWEVNPPWRIVEFSDGRSAAIQVVLTCVTGKIYASTIIGSATSGADGKVMLDVRFDLPKSKIKISKVKMISDIPVKCNEVIWYDFQAK